MTDDSLIAPLRDSIGIVAQNNDLKAQLKRQELLIATLQQENALLRRTRNPPTTSDFDLAADALPALLRRQV
jgi:hypothetical protein